MPDVIGGLAWLMRTKHIDRIVALDDFDVEKGAELREQFRIPGMGQTTARHFRDKLAMRMKAAEAGIPVPPFSALFNDDDIHHFTQTIATPWIVKPRGQASATGMKKINSAEELWLTSKPLAINGMNSWLNSSNPVMCTTSTPCSTEGKMAFARVSKYLAPPFDVAHGGGYFRSAVVPFGSKDDKALQKHTAQVMEAFGMQYSASHTEFIKAHEDGKYYFLETSSRVGGAHLSEIVEYSAGFNIWEEWAEVEVANVENRPYKAPKDQKKYAGIIV